MGGRSGDGGVTGDTSETLTEREKDALRRTMRSMITQDTEAHEQAHVLTEERLERVEDRLEHAERLAMRVPVLEAKVGRFEAYLLGVNGQLGRLQRANKEAMEALSDKMDRLLDIVAPQPAIPVPTPSTPVPVDLDGLDLGPVPPGPPDPAATPTVPPPSVPAPPPSPVLPTPAPASQPPPPPLPPPIPSAPPR